MDDQMKTQVPPRAAAIPPGVELDLAATSERAPSVFGLEPLVDRLLALIGAGRRRPVLVGPGEVGKTAVARALAHRIARGARPGGASAVWQVSLRTLSAQDTNDEGVGSLL